jgi:UDP-N-acetylglucosamine acyltransferase
MGTILLQDLPPYVTASGNPSAPHGINSEGLKRRGFGAANIAALKRAYKTLYRGGLKLEEATAAIAAMAAEAPGDQASLAVLADFLAAPGRGILR